MEVVQEGGVIHRLYLRQPDDMHLHVRDGAMLEAVIPYTAHQFRRAIIMPNLTPGVTTVEAAKAYRERIMVAAQHFDFEPLMTLYLTEETSVEEVLRAKESGFVHAFKYYPRGATTNSSQGVRDLRHMSEVLKVMEACGMPLLLHGETNFMPDGTPIDPFDKERYFVREELPWLRESFLKLRMVLEHITTKDAADYVFRCHDMSRDNNLAATVTPHHLMFDRLAMFDGGLNPHVYCLPVLKRSEDLKALRSMVTGGLPCFFAGTDSAPHPTHAKERACGCAAGCFVAPVALSMYAQVFEEEGELEHLERFLSENGADWYGLPRNEGSVTLSRQDKPIDIRKLTEVGPSGSTVSSAGDVNVRTFGVHDDPTKSMKLYWQVAA